MNSREIDAEVRRLAAERGWDGLDEDSRTVMIFLLLSEREGARHQLASHLQSLKRDIERLEQMIRPASPILNSLGELQQRPAAVEAAVGAFAAADRALRDYLKLYPALEA